MLQAIGQLGTNWTTIASKHLPSRTTLALKNRYNALRAKMACNGRPTPMDKAGTHQPAARHLTNSRNKSSNQLSSPPTVDGEDEEGQDDGDDDHEDDRNSGDDDDDDDDEPKTSEEEDFTSATSPSNDLMEMQNLSPLRFPPASSMAPPECRLYPPYHLNAFQHSGLVSTPPFTTTSMALSGVPDLGSYHENTNLEGDGLSTSPPWTIQNTEYSLNGETPPPVRRWNHSELTRRSFQDVTHSHYLTVSQREPLWPTIGLIRERWQPIHALDCEDPHHKCTSTAPTPSQHRFHQSLFPHKAPFMYPVEYQKPPPLCRSKTAYRNHCSMYLLTWRARLSSYRKSWVQ